VVPAADSLSRVFPVRVRLKNTQDLMRPGMSVTALVPTGVDVEALTAHKDAILRDEAGAYLYYDMGGRAMLARVDVLYPVGDRVVIRSRTLEAGTRVVIEGNERLFPGQPLMIESEPGAAAGASPPPGRAGAN
jgi:multidrug efflux pump subunit AcrA (membrane-fusion protein)